MQVVLYTTLGCHLCEQAAALAAPICEELALELLELEIADSADLLEHYGERIPVMGVSGYQPELNWPFDASAVRVFLMAAARGG